eukprot:CAMPEP_0116543930 /NCGR_PEP_ID=MMETSP0397-20121206/1835_1 /TAXON_ID=216820 /ORGANISM="Cyclophora tenuis, Strain ECT3854" /LENGTH=525 /DNA_ID=CAMNT_0004068085 /DNA_START=93 /DNA_END=1670 /DNA_ORIENTATION=-
MEDNTTTTVPVVAYNGSFIMADNTTLSNSSLFNNTTADGSSSSDASQSSSLMVWAWPNPRHRRAAIARAERERREAEDSDPVRRKRMLDSCLISKRVIACDADRNLTLGDVEEESGSLDGGDEEDYLEEHMSLNEDNEDESACVICLEAFRVGDVVTWSKDMDCRHVFHKECLMEWLNLPGHDDCPSCRCKILYLEGKTDSTNIHHHHHDDEDDDYDDEEGSQSFAFVIMNGLISPLRRASYSLIGSSVQVENIDEEGGTSADDDANSKSLFRRRSSVPHQLRRVLSAGATETPTRLGIALRRVSSGIYSKLSRGGSFDHSPTAPPRSTTTANAIQDSLYLTPSIESKDSLGSWKRPFRLRRCLSEGYRSVPTTTPPTATLTPDLETAQSSSSTIPTFGGSDSFDLEMGSFSHDSTTTSGTGGEVMRPKTGLFRRGYRRSSSAGAYARLGPTLDSVADQSSYYDGETDESDDDEEDLLEPRTLFDDDNSASNNSNNNSSSDLEAAVVDATTSHSFSLSMSSSSSS